MRHLRTILLWTCGVLLFLVTVLWAKSQDSWNSVIFDHYQDKVAANQYGISTIRGRVIFGWFKIHRPRDYVISPEYAGSHWGVRTYSSPVTPATPAGPWYGFEFDVNTKTALPCASCEFHTGYSRSHLPRH